MIIGLKDIKTHKIFDIEYNGWVYEKVCLDELSNYAQMLIANFLIHLVMYRCGKVKTKLDLKHEKNKKNLG